MSVDLPAPRSPTRAWASPARSVKSTPARAVTPAKALAMPVIRSRGSSLTGGLSVGLVEEVGRVGGVEQAVPEEDARGHGPAGQVLLQGLERQGAEAGVGLDTGAQLAAEDRLQGGPLAVD